MASILSAPLVGIHMDHTEAGKYWNDKAEVWTRLSRAGYDVYRDYLKLKEGMRKFRVPRFSRTLSEWFNLLIETGFTIERVEEPRPSDEVVRACPAIQDAQLVAYFLHVRARKPLG